MCNSFADDLQANNYVENLSEFPVSLNVLLKYHESTLNKILRKLFDYITQSVKVC